MNTWKPAVPVTPELRRAFTPEECPPELAEISAELLIDIHDIAFKFGAERSDEPVKNLSHSTPISITISVSSKPDNRSIIVLGPDTVTREGAYTIKLANDAGVMWDARVSILQMKQFIVNVDTIAFQYGAIMSNGERKPLRLSATTSTYEVDVVFETPAATMMVLPPPTTEPTYEVLRAEAERLRLHFDRPEEVAFYYDDLLGIASLIRKRDEPHHTRRRLVIERILQRRGLRLTRRDIAQLPLEEILALQAEIDAAMETEDTT